MRKHVSPAINDAYARYQAEALVHFDLEASTETIRQYMEHISLCDAIGDHVKSQALRRTVEQERAHVLDLATALTASASRVRAAVPRGIGVGLTMLGEA